MEIRKLSEWKGLNLFTIQTVDGLLETMSLIVNNLQSWKRVIYNQPVVIASIT